jgi:hypothetical protein
MNKSPNPPLIALDKFMRDIGRDRVTGWRWRKRGWLTTVNIAGREYVTDDEAQKFTARAVAGEFAKQPKGLCRKAVAA